MESMLWEAALSNVPPEQRREVAAFALHGQPFGFSWEMVDAIRDTVTAAEMLSGPDDSPEIQIARSAADRIAALLPPREPKP